MYFSTDFITDSLDGGKFAWKADKDRFDLNGDGYLDAHDCPYQYGSPEAKLWWKNIIEPSVKSQITPEMQAKYGAKVSGSYLDKPLASGENEVGAGDYKYLVDKLQITQGLSYSSASKVAMKVMTYGGSSEKINII